MPRPAARSASSSPAAPTRPARGTTSHRRTRSSNSWVGRAADAAGHGPDGPRFTADTPLSALGVEARTLVAVAAALAERPKAVVVDLDDDPGASTVELWHALARLVPASVTLIVGVGTSAAAPDSSPELAARGIRTLEPVSTMKEVAR